MKDLLIHNARVILPERLQQGGVLVREGRIANIFAENETPAGFSASESLDLRGAYLSPGFVDIHIHGSGGVDVQDADSAALTTLSQFLLIEGVTGYFATFVPADQTGYELAIAEIDACIRSQDQTGTRGARILGIHFEGPFVSHNRCGALRRQYFRTYDGDPRSLAVFAGTGDTGNRLMTLAPEIEGGLDLTRDLTASGLRVFIGHTQADRETLDKAFEAGARHITHFPNALDPLHHRKPGAVAWGLVRKDVTFDCIADFHHVDPLMLKLMYQTKTVDRMALISDAIKPAGLGDGEFMVWGERISVENGRTSLAGTNLASGPGGTIAGSVITMREAVKNMAGIGVPIHEAVKMASLVPARAAGVAAELGSIEQGKRADLIAFDDDLSVRLAVIDGLAVLASS